MCRESPKEMGCVEGHLESLGVMNCLQEYRWVVEGQPDQQLLTGITETEYELRSINLLEERARASYNDSPHAWTLEEHQTFMKGWDERYRLACGKWWKYKSKLPEGPWLRGFELWRSNPKWYMHRILCEGCEARNGCCSRNCGCCLKRLDNPERKLGVGHCTTDCPCCTKARGFRSEEPKKGDPLFEPSKYKDIALPTRKATLLGASKYEMDNNVGFGLRGIHEDLIIL